MQRLREEGTRALQEAWAQVQAHCAWSQRLRPLAISWIDCPHLNLGALSLPILGSVPNECRESFVQELEKSWHIKGSPLLTWTGVSAVFVNFSWSEQGCAEILRLASAPPIESELLASPVALQNWGEQHLEQILDCRKTDAASKSERDGVRWAYMRTLALESMGLVHLRAIGDNETIADNDLIQPSLISLQWMKSASLLSTPLERELLTRVERLVWNALHHPTLISAQRSEMARLWNDYYEHNRLLQGSAEMLWARLCLARAVRCALETRATHRRKSLRAFPS